MASRPKLKTTPDERGAQEYCKYFEQPSRGSRSFSARGSAARWLLSYGELYLGSALFLSALLLLRRFGPYEVLPVGMLVHLPDAGWCALFALPLLVLLGFKAWRPMLAFLVFAVACSVHVARPAMNLAVTRAERNLVLVTYNVEAWSHGASAVHRVLAAADPDVVCLQEAGDYFWRHQADQKPSALYQRMPGYQPVGRGEVWILSRLPVLRSETVELPMQYGDRPLLLAEVEFRGKRVAIGCYHGLPSFILAPSARQVPGWAPTANAKAEQLSVLARATLPASTAPIVFAGDFNFPGYSAPFAALLKTHDDAWDRAGFGLGYTTEVQRIDRIFVPRAVAVRRIDVLPEVASDHHAVRAELSVLSP
jgi:endonuclease/exonuclease/phosphatase family metal-dependent hydrolase